MAVSIGTIVAASGTDSFAQIKADIDAEITARRSNSSSALKPAIPGTTTAYTVAPAVGTTNFLIEHPNKIRDAIRLISTSWNTVTAKVAGDIITAADLNALRTEVTNMANRDLTATTSTGNDCTTICVGACYSACYNGCNNKCGGGCSTGCGSGCSGGCTGVCIGCTTSCGLNCWNSCGTVCLNVCGTCLNGCGTTCNLNCSSGCRNGCGTTCAGSCTGTCSGCSGGCLGGAIMPT